MFLVAVEVNSFFVKNGSIVDIGKFVGLNCICHDAVANLCLLTVHTEIQSLQNLLKGIGDILKRIFVAAEDTIVITVADDFVVWKSLSSFLIFFCFGLQCFVQQKVRITKDYLTHKVKDGTTLRNTNVATLL